MPPERRRRHAIGARHQLLVGRPDDEFVVTVQRRFGMKRQKRVQNGQRTIRCADELARFTDMLEHMPFMGDRLLGHRLRDGLTRHQAKRHRSPPKGRR